MIPFGMPGIGGSLGTCALCGQPFLTEILLGKKVPTFTMPGVKNKLFGHDGCLKKYDGKEATDLPAESPIRQLYESQNASSPSAASNASTEEK